MIDDNRFRKLLEPGQIGRVRTRNRIIKTAAGTGLIEKDGIVGQPMVDFYETMAKGGVGLLIYEYCAVEYPRGMLRPTCTAHLSDDKFIPSYSRMVEAVHKHDCPFFTQLMHSGPWYQSVFWKGFPDAPGDRVGPSTITAEELPPGLFTPIRELSVGEIEGLVETFGKAAERAKKIGFDGIEVNGSHYHLINAFFSPFWNRRHDRYGCDNIENRARFMCSIVGEAKRVCGKEYPVTALFNAVEYGVENGTTLDDAKGFAKVLEEAGADAIQVRAAGYGSFSGILHPDRFFYPELPKELKVKEFDWSQKGKGLTVPLGAAIRQVVSVPVFLAGRLDPELGEKILGEGKLDFIGMTRRLFADPELPHKVAECRLEDIAPCSGCNYCWHIRAYVDSPLRCRINAALGRHREFEILPTAKKKRVLVAGGGPAGLEAARIAALRGHDVTLYEKETKLGGLMRLAALVKDHEIESIISIIDYLSVQNRKLGVTMRLGKPVDSSVVDEIRPDVLILAAGGTPSNPIIRGIDHPKVVNNANLHRTLKFWMRFFGPKAMERLTKLWMPIGKTVVIIGGGLEGCQLAEFLVKRGRKVTIVDSEPTLGKGLLSDDPDRLFKWFHKKGVVTFTGVTYEAVSDEGLIVTTKEGERKTLMADSIITALPLRPAGDLAESLGKKVAEVYEIGDCREPGYMYDAIADGYRIGRVI
jgi:2,4-dienoyl-CoA reductase (NADPH2)